MDLSEPRMTIGKVAARAGIRISHIRYYEEVGVLPVAERVSGQRRYDEDVLRRLSIIDIAQRAGMTLDEIRELTGPRLRDESAGQRLRELAEHKLPHIEALIERAQAVKSWLEIAGSCDCQTVDACGLFVDPALAPPASDVTLDISRIRAASAQALDLKSP